MPFTRETYQSGSLLQEPRAKGAVWIYRYRETGPAGNRVQRKLIIGNVRELKTKALAQKALAAMNLRINSTQPQQRRGPITILQLVEHYKLAELGPERKTKTKHTCEVYKFNLRNHIVPQWGDRRAESLTAPEVEAWLYKLALANGTKAKLRNIMSAVWNHGIRHQLILSNPIIGAVKGSGVRQSAKRERIPDVLTAEETSKLIAELAEPYRTMIYLLATTGIRFSELRGLQWRDLEPDKLTLDLRRGVIGKKVGVLKNSVSRQPIPIAREVCEALQAFRLESAYRADDDWMFASVAAGGKIPIWPSSALADHIKPAVQRAGISKRVGWHTLRHSYATRMKASGEDVKTVQASLRHATSAVTMDVYTQAISSTVRTAHERMATEITLSKRAEAACVPRLFLDLGAHAVSC